jgi:hypothetical protein
VLLAAIRELAQVSTGLGNKTAAFLGDIRKIA